MRWEALPRRDEALVGAGALVRLAMVFARCSGSTSALIGASERAISPPDQAAQPGQRVR
ncbi:hypothetical protein [Saccharopolyspora rectivirgula]|uniref:hypothetical protein n=1 Tax=Saccharopolyspora rectivirgula TaxID=28042 RepID=UPI0003F6C908|nr:hypothetical protein [Saccharopolyspora rectivirgula]